MHVGLNAHLLSSGAGYRAAGIHGYIYNTLVHLPRVAGADWRFSALVGGRNPFAAEGLRVQRAHMDTDAPLRRIVWEQVVQPFQLGTYDLYHAMAFVAPALPIKPPFVVTVYDLSFIHHPQVLSTARRAYLQAFTAHTVRRAARVIAISESTAQDVRETFGVPNVDVAPPGTDFEWFKPLPHEQVTAFRHENNLPQDFWLFVGTLEPRKNLPTLLRAYAQLPKDTRPPLVLGGGKGWDYAPIFETIARYRLEDDVRTPGFLPVEDLPLWYNSAALFVYPSLFEGFGIPPLEAMACGTPVLVSDVSSLPEVVAGSANMCVPPDDVAAWVDALTTALDNPNWRRRAAESGLQVARRYTWGNTAHQTLNSYHRALGM